MYKSQLGNTLIRLSKIIDLWNEWLEVRYFVVDPGACSHTTGRWWRSGWSWVTPHYLDVESVIAGLHVTYCACDSSFHCHQNLAVFVYWLTRSHQRFVKRLGSIARCQLKLSRLEVKVGQWKPAMWMADDYHQDKEWSVAYTLAYRREAGKVMVVY